MLDILPSKTSPINGTIYWVFFKSTVSRSAATATCSRSEECTAARSKNSVLVSRFAYPSGHPISAFNKRCTIRSGYRLIGDVKCV